MTTTGELKKTSPGMKKQGSKMIAAQIEDDYIANFNYTPVTAFAPLTNKVVFTVGNPSYASLGPISWTTSPQFANMEEAIKRDIGKLLVAKGFDLRGPYATYDLIPFQDKKDIDLFVIITLVPSVTVNHINERLESIWKYESPTLQTGEAQMTGTINVEMREIVTKELMWAKTIPLKKVDFQYVGRIPWGKPHEPGEIYDTNALINGMAKGLDQQYPEVMATIYSLIDPQEMAIIQKQAKELKTKKGY